MCADGGAEILNDSAAPRQLLASMAVPIICRRRRVGLLVGHGILDIGVGVLKTAGIGARRLGVVEGKADEVVFVGGSYGGHGNLMLD